MKAGPILFAIAAVWMAAATAPGAEESALFEDDFSPYAAGRRPAGYSKKGVVAVENGNRYLSCTGGFGYLFEPGLMTYWGSAKWRDLDFRVRFRFRDSEKYGLSLVVKAGGFRLPDKPFTWYYIGFDKTGVNAMPMNAPPPLAESNTLRKVAFTNLGLPHLGTGTWYAVRASVREATLEVFLENGGTNVLLLSGSVIPGGGGVNLLSYHPIDIDDVRVTEPGKDP